MAENRKLHAPQPRLIAEMTLAQAESKRASDRAHQRYSRARKQNRVAELERKNATLTSQLVEMEKQFQELRKSYDDLQAAVCSNHAVIQPSGNPPSSLLTTQFPNNSEDQVTNNSIRLQQTNSDSPASHPGSSPISLASPLIGYTPVNLNSITSCFFDLPLLDFGTALINNLRDDDALSPHNSVSTLPEENYFESLPWLICDSPVQGPGATSVDACGSVIRTTSEIEHEIEVQADYSLGPLISEWSQAGQLLPVHLPPTTPTDHVLIEVSEFGRRWSQQKGDQYAELWLPNFPSILPLLKPTSSDAALNPISSAVGKHSTWATSVHSLASRVAYHYMVAQMIRWMVCRTEQSYRQLPPFLRPTQLQRVVPHPAWIDVFPWIEGRDLIIKHMDYGKFDSFHDVTASFSVNWPYRDEDIFLKDPTHHYLFLNPVFEAHIRDAKNWTFDAAVGELFPFLRSCPTTVVK